MIKSIFHININVTNFDRSLEFYKTLGFKVALNIGEGANPANDKGSVSRTASGVQLSSRSAMIRERRALI